MASRFVSAGGAELKAPEGLSSATDDAWAKAKQQVEESKKPHKESPAPGTQEGGISLYEHLQNQKAAKQEAFEEASKLRNQFRPLDDGEVDFLEGIKQKERLKAASERQETAEQLEAFRRARANAEGGSDGSLIASTDVNENEDSVVWTTTKKRRKGPPGGHSESAKVRKLGPETSTQPKQKELETPQTPENTEINAVKETKTGSNCGDTATRSAPVVTAPPVVKKSLISYDSDSDD